MNGRPFDQFLHTGDYERKDNGFVSQLVSKMLVTEDQFHPALPSEGFGTVPIWL